MPEVKQFMVDLAKEAGEIIRANFGLAMKKEWKQDGSPVTETDKKINRLVIERVQKIFPDHGVIGEEESDHNNQEYLWVCDPVDGTIPFSHGIPLPVFMLALVQNGKPIAGVIYDPLMDRMFYAEKGQGAELNGEKIRVVEADALAGKLVEVTNWLTAEYHISNLADQIEGTGATATHMCAMYPTVLVACGEYIGGIYAGPSTHDVAALKILVEEAGGRVTDLWGKEQRYDRPIKGAIISNGKVHDKLLAIVQKNLKEKQWQK